MSFVLRDRHGSFASVSIELRKVFVLLLPRKTCVGRAAGGTLEQTARLFSQYFCFHYFDLKVLLYKTEGLLL